MQQPSIQELIQKEAKRQDETLMLIPSENYASQDVRDAVGSVLMNKYSEGYAGARYYQGNKFIDEIEVQTIQKAMSLFDVPYANVQPYSGSPANAAIYFALLKPGDTIMGLNLAAGGHLTHGHPDITFSGRYFNSVQYGVNKDGIIDMEEVRKLAKKHKPKLITVGTTAYPRVFDWAVWKEIADEVDAYLHADISHIAGLIAGGAHPSPSEYVDIIMTTTHKTLRGPRGAMIMVTDTGIQKDKDMGKKIDRAVFPGLQGGPHNNTTAGIAVALTEAFKPEFRDYAQQVVKNAQALATELASYDIDIVTRGTDNHLLVLDLRNKNIIGNIAAEALEVAGIIVNRNAIPHDPQPPFYPSGIRIGTPAITTRGMKEEQMIQIAEWISRALDRIPEYTLPKDPKKRREFMREVRQELRYNKQLLMIQDEVRKLSKEFPIT